MKISPRFFFRVIENDIGSIPWPVKLVVFALFVHSLAWGVLEPLEAIYFDSFVDSYLEIGIIFASFNVVLLLLAIPGGALSDRVSMKKLVIVGLLFYPVVGTLYFKATRIIELFAARVLNGVGATFVWISAESFIRKKSVRNRTAETFGFYATATNAALIIGAIAGYFLISPSQDIGQLFLLLVPLPIIASFITWKISTKKKENENIQQGIEEVVRRDGFVTGEIIDYLANGFPAFYCLVMAFFGGFFLQLLLVFIPLTASHMRLALNEVLILYALAHIPLLAGFFFSELADRVGKPNFIFLGLLLAAIVLPIVYFFPQDALAFTIVCFFFGISLAMIGPALNGLVSDITPKSESGEVTGMINAAYYFGCAAGPLFFGALSDAYGLTACFVAAAGVALSLAFATVVLKGFLSPKKTILKVSQWNGTA